MILLHRLKSLARWIFRRNEVERQLHDDVESFIELSAEARIRDGATPEEARRLARLEIGGADQAKERVRAYRWGAHLEQLWQDLRYGLRAIVRQPGFTATVVLTLAIGIGANTAIYTVVDATLLRGLPFQEPDRLMRVSLTMPPEAAVVTADDMVWSYPKYETFRENQRVFEDTALYRSVTVDLRGGGEPERVSGEEVGAGYFPLLGIRAAVGRSFSPEEDVMPGKDLVAMISHGLWQRRFGGDRAVVGKTIDLDSRKYTVVGVLPPDFQGLSGPAEVWVTVHRLDGEVLGERWAHAWELVARLKNGVTMTQAKAAVAALGKAVDEVHPYPYGSGGRWGAHASELDENRLDPALRKSVLVLFGAVLCVVLIACVNVANLLLARGSTRSREIAIRSAIGAGRSRVMRQLLTESLLLAILGGTVSLVVAHVSVYALSTLNPAVNTFLFGRQLPGLTLLGFHTIRLDSRALVFTFATALLAGLLFGLAPSWQNSRTELSDALKKATSRSFAFRFVSLKSLLVVIEIALAFVLLAGAGLMIKSSSRLSATQIGVDAENVLTVRTTLTVGPGLQTTALRFTDLEERIGADPRVISAAVGSCHALASRCGNTGVRFPDRPAAKSGEQPVIGTVRVSPNYFKTMKIPLLRGRVFAASDQLNAPRVVIINETAAKRFWANEDPIDKPISIGRFRDAKVIGVVGDVRYGRMDQLPEPDAYFSQLQSPTTDMLLFVRTAGDPTFLVPAVRQLMRTIDPNAPVYDIKTMRARIGDATARMRINAILLGIFAAIAMVLSAVGIFGVMSYVARQSTREIGIRMALGALSQDVIMQGLRRAAGLVVAGGAIGLLGALAVTRVLATSLYEVTPTDPQTYLVISILLAAVAMLASYIPVRRASLLNPSITLRGE